MRMAGYYAWHTFINSIRKMFRSTVVVVIVSVAAIGMIFGLSAGLISAIAESKPGTDTEYVSETDSETVLFEFGDDTEAIGDNEDNEDNGEFVIGGTAVSESSFIASCFEFGIPVAFIAVLLLVALRRHSGVTHGAASVLRQAEAHQVSRPRAFIHRQTVVTAVSYPGGVRTTCLAGGGQCGD